MTQIIVARYTEAHCFLFGWLRMHLLGWPSSLAPQGRRFSLNSAEGGRAQALHTSCIDTEKPSG
jgi:hypothetical protein